MKPGKASQLTRNMVYSIVYYGLTLRVSDMVSKTLFFNLDSQTLILSVHKMVTA